MKNSLIPLAGTIIRWSLYVGIFLTPIFLLPFTPYPVDLNKQALLTALVGIAGLAWIVRALAEGKFEYPKSPLAALSGGLAVFAVISALVSGARHVGFMGVTGAEPDTALAMATFAVLFFLVAGEFGGRGDVRRIVSALLIGAGATVLHMALQVAGGSLPWGFASGVGFNPVGMPNAFALYLAFAFALAFAMSRETPKEDKKTRGAYIGLATVLFIGIGLIGYWPAFLAIAIAVLVIMWSIMSVKSSAGAKRDLVPGAVIALAILMSVMSFGVVPITVPRMNVPTELVPTVRASWNIGAKTVMEGVGRFVFGSGPATFQYQYGKHRDAALNQGSFWAVPFAQGKSAIFTQFVNGGVLGIILFMAFLVMVVREMILAVRGRRDPDGALVGLIAGMSCLVVAFLVYPQNFTLYFLFFLGAALLSASRVAHKEVACKSFGRSLGLMLALLIILGVSYANGRRYVAGIIFERGIAQAAESQDIERAIPYLAYGADLDPKNSVYMQILGNALFARARVYAGAVTGVPSDADRAKIQAALAGAIAAAERAVIVNPRNAAGVINLAQAYVQAISLDPNAAAGAFAAYAAAGELEPNNPAIPFGLGQAHATNAASEEKGVVASEWQKAIQAFEAAIELKADYVPARLALIEALERAGKSAEAIARAEALRADAVGDAGVLFQLGALHYGAGRFEKARGVLSDVVRLAPDYANALYFLGLTYDKLGDRGQAMVQFQKVLQLNPGNKEVEVVIANMRAGRSALDASAGVPVPIEPEKPKDIPKPR